MLLIALTIVSTIAHADLTPVGATADEVKVEAELVMVSWYRDHGETCEVEGPHGHIQYADGTDEVVMPSESSDEYVLDFTFSREQFEGKKPEASSDDSNEKTEAIDPELTLKSHPFFEEWDRQLKENDSFGEAFDKQLKLQLAKEQAEIEEPTESATIEEPAESTEDSPSK